MRNTRRHRSSIKGKLMMIGGLCLVGLTASSVLAGSASAHSGQPPTRERTLITTTHTSWQNYYLYLNRWALKPPTTRVHQAPAPIPTRATPRVAPTPAATIPVELPPELPAEVPSTTAPSTTPRAVPPAAPSLPAGVAEVLTLTNNARAASGCQALRLNTKLTAAAQQHTVWQTTNGMSHAGANGSQVNNRVDAVGYKWAMVGENVAYGYPNAVSVMQGWMESEGHRQNILSCQFTEIGVGVAPDGEGRLYWTQVFATPRGW